jgi:hypothetical protein
MSDRCPKSEAQALNVRVESRECFREVCIDNQCKIIIVYNVLYKTERPGKLVKENLHN